jgi:ankyrin repeat protein
VTFVNTLKIKTLQIQEAMASEDDFESKYPLQYAAGRGMLPMVKYLIEQRGYNMDNQAEGRMNWTALHYAAYYNRKPVIEYLLAKKANTFLVNVCY